jgi:hypothetical protein
MKDLSARSSLAMRIRDCRGFTLPVFVAEQTVSQSLQPVHLPVSIKSIFAMQLLTSE